MDKVAGSKNDEFYTPQYAIYPILKYLKPHSVIWCPFDTKDSNFFKILKEKGHKVICSHIDEGTDFFNYVPRFEYDYIISNPPYSLKTEILNRLFLLKKPFAMLVGVVGLFESQKRFEEKTMSEDKIKINVTKKLIVKPESLFVATIKPLGNGAYAPIKKSLIGKEVYVIIKDEVREEK